ncbi:MAG TPA: PQQ-binding-like beta-propeller repeat protein [Ktedonobacteraceae bacterium]|nr:PQQ-binding-like beta-propeller repeat protein [Ktedonobacteraceae bacterium]
MAEEQTQNASLQNTTEESLATSERQQAARRQQQNAKNSANKTPSPPVTEPATILDTPLPSMNENEQDILPETSRPVEDKAASAGVKQAMPPVTVVVRPVARPRSRRRLIKGAAMLIALLLFIGSFLLLWQNVNQAHLFLYSIDPGNGQTLAQQDLGGYASISALSNPAHDQSSLLLGVSTTPSAQQQVLSLTGSGTSWNISRQYSAPPGHFTLSMGPSHVVAAENGDGLQVMNSAGRVLWQARGDAPLLGAHAFTPTFDSSTIYTIKSARQGNVAAYDIHNGSVRWMVHVDDTLEYAPPLLLMGNTLYVAGDHRIYALNTTTGGIRWKAAAPARTLLSSSAKTPALITAGASGLMAFDAQSGDLLWSFNGHPGTGTNGDTLTAAQFYQAGLLATSNTLYATGVVWNVQQAQQQLWLFAVNAGTGKPLWSERIGTGFTGADAGRVFAPFIDATHRRIVIEQAQADGNHSLNAFDSENGLPRWHLRLAAVSAFTPDIIKLSSDSLSIFSVQTGVSITLRAGSAPRLLLFALAFASLLALLLLWILPLKDWLRRLPRTLLAPLRGVRQLWRFSRLLFALILIVALICAGLLVYAQLNRPQAYIKQVKASGGNAVWQHTISSSITLAGASHAGTLTIADVGDHTYQLSTLGSNGLPRWTLPSGEATFSFPQVATPAGTMLAVLNGPATLDYHYAPVDPAYSNPLAHYCMLYLLDSNTGQVIWQNNLVQAGALQEASVLGADSQFIYIANRSLQQNQVAQLMAVDKSTGMIEWRVYGPRGQTNAAPDFGALVIQGNFIYWQVDNTVYAVSTQTGQIEWRDAIAEITPRVSVLEERQMATNAGILLIRRSDMYHALDLVTGTERWTLSGLGVDDQHMPGGVIAVGNKFILYGGGSIEVYDSAAQKVLWKHSDLVAVSNVSISPDGSLVYAVVFNRVDGGANAQALVAFDMNTNLIHWTFQPDAQARLVYAGSRIIYTARGMIYATTCYADRQGNCTRQVLYGIDGKTGKTRWKMEALRIYDAQLSQDGTTLTFQTSSSAWENLKTLFRG